MQCLVLIHHLFPSHFQRFQIEYSVILLTSEQMGCCSPSLKLPSPYQFAFTGTNPPPSNSKLFQSNRVKTSKYNILTFVPMCLFNQFKRLANIYFLLIAILQSIPQISPLSPLTAWAPLIVVIVISMIRQGIEDFARYKSDIELNERSKCLVKRGERFEEVPWSEIIVGDVCLVEQDQTFPADLLILSSSDQGGNAYIETASLDGQKNLKPRLALKETNMFREQESLGGLRGDCGCSQPDKGLHNFQGTILIQNNPKKIIFEGDKQFLFRGAKLKNTKWIYGLTVYTGRLTKIMLNSQLTSSKMSQIEHKVNALLVLIFFFQIVLCFVCAIAYGIKSNELTTEWYLEKPSSIIGNSCLIFLSYLVLFNTMIPISLVVSLEIVKSVQGVFIQKDSLLYSEFRGKGATVFSSSLNEELGQIEYIFSDKTGTLTCNIMEFKIAVVGGEMFGDRSLISDEEGDSADIPPAGGKGFYDKGLDGLLKQGVNDQLFSQGYELRCQETNQPLLKFNSLKELAEEYLLLLSLAHECVVDYDKNNNLVYQGPSPDEITLVQAAKNMGFVFKRSDNQYFYIQRQGREERIEVLGVHPFTSDRKRMSVIVRHNGVIKMMIKGADSVVKKRLGGEQPFEKKIFEYLNLFALKGLRTLLIAERVLSEGEYQRFKEAESRLPEQGRAKAREQLIDDLEHHFSLLGATAVLDRLQDNVPETIRDLIRANIKIWMLTGDKLETAENIAMSCNLIQPSFEVIKFAPAAKNYDQELQRCAARAHALTKSGASKAFLIEGEHLAELMQVESNKQLLAQMAKNCDTVVCCRLLPLQKAEVVQLVRQRLNKITLAIGDGANDVPMIKMAHIGVGLYGQQGMGSVQASDYALPEFQGLWRLLLVHGRWNYIRVSEMILYFFYKNMVFTIPQFYFAFYCSYSGLSFFDDTYISLYNIVFTALPLIVRAILEQDIYYIYKTEQDGVHEIKNTKVLPEDFEIRPSLRELFPKIYNVGQKNTIFNYTNFFVWIIEAILQALLITLICIYVLGGNVALNQSGINSDFYIVGLTAFSAIIVVVTFKIASHTRFWSVLSFIALIFLSLGLYIAYMWISDVVNTSVTGTIKLSFTTLEIYLTVFLCTGVVLIVDGIVIYISHLMGGYAAKMRTVVGEDHISDYNFYEQMEINFSHVPRQ